jgi:CHAD domain-containing protein
VPVLHDDLRWLSRGLSRLRDLDVVSAEGWRGPFAAWLDAEHVAAQRDAAALLQHPRLEGLLRALAVVAPLRRRPARDGHEALVDAVDAAWKALRDARPAGVLSALHRLRRRARSARYACEWLGLDASRFRLIQEAAGAACDVVALAGLVEAFERDTSAASSDAARLVATVRKALVPALLANGPP